MLVETPIQFVGPMLLEMAVREVAVPATKKMAWLLSLGHDADVSFVLRLG